MNSKISNVMIPKNIQELQHYLGEYPNAKILAGGTGFLLKQIERTFSLPLEIISVQYVSELLQISKTERYIDIGASVTLNKIIALGRKNIPEILYLALITIANYPVRNLATLAGNIAMDTDYMTLLPPLVAIDAKIELKTATETALVPITKFLQSKNTKTQEINNFFPRKNITNSGYCITKIRIPLNDWDISYFKRLAGYNSNALYPNSFALIMSLEKNILSDIRISYGGKYFFRQKELENRLVGHLLPLSLSDIDSMVSIASEYIQEIPEKQMIVRRELKNMIKNALLTLR